MTRHGNGTPAVHAGAGPAARAVLAGMCHCALGSLAAGFAASAVLGALVLVLGG